MIAGEALEMALAIGFFVCFHVYVYTRDHCPIDVSKRSAGELLCWSRASVLDCRRLKELSGCGSVVSVKLHTQSGAADN